MSVRSARLPAVRALFAALALVSGCNHRPAVAPSFDGGGPDAGRRHVHRDAGARPMRIDAGFFCNGAPGFPGPPMIEGLPYAYEPYGLAVGDVTGDGKPDLIVSNGQVIVLPGLGNATFGRPIVSAQQALSALAVADLDGDGNLDVIANDGRIGVYLGRGDGTFRPMIPVGGARYVVVGDINHDGHPDLVATLDFKIATMLGRGDGTFVAPVFTHLTDPACAAPGFPALADFNRDGLLDVACGGGVLLSLDGGALSPLLTPPGFGSQAAVATGDLDGDGNADLVGSGMVAYLGNGDGTFRQTFAESEALGNDHLLLADFDGDKHLDVVLACTWGGSTAIGMRRGRGDGTFEAKVTYPTASQVMAVAAADLNGDGLPDVIVRGPNAVTILLGKPDGTLLSEELHIAGNLPGALVVADLDGDGTSDIATANLFGKDVSILLGRRDGSLSRPVSVRVGTQPTTIATDDLNGDGHADLVVGNLADGTISVLLGRGDGTYLPQATIASSYGLNGLLIGDVDDDGIPDLLVDNPLARTRGLLLGNGDGTFQHALPLGLPSFPLLLADVDGDGSLDAVTTTGLFLGNGDGTFRPSSTIFVDAVALGDFDGDGNVDLVSAKGPALRITLGPVVSGGSQAIDGGTRDDIASLAVADFNGDGHLDLAKSFRVQPTVELLLGKGDGTFQEPRRYPVSESGGKLSVGDLNGDGRMDLVVTTSTSNVGVLLNTGCY
jgi:hypothetical protein